MCCVGVVVGMGQFGELAVTRIGGVDEEGGLTIIQRRVDGGWWLWVGDGVGVYVLIGWEVGRRGGQEG